MKKTYTIAASLLTVVSMTAGIGGITTSAQTQNDNYSTFTYTFNNQKKATVSLKNNTQGLRYANVSAIGADAYGNFAGSISNYRTINNAESVVAENYLYSSAVSASFSGVMYFGTVPYGTELSNFSGSITLNN